ncbi:MAG: hypothetical protein ACYDA3_13070 [Gaiellaceae bacterium]
MPFRREAAGAFVLAGAIAAALLWLGPPGSDTAAHVYQRWLFMQHGLVSWDNYWYSGRWVFVTYSLLYYPLAALVGIKLLAVASIGVGAAAFTLIARSKPAAFAFAVVWGLYTLSGAYPFMLGTAFALLAVLARRLWLFALLAALAWAASPLAVLLLLVVVAGLRRRNESIVALAFALLQVVLAHIYPGRGHFPFRWQEALAALVFAAGGALLARDSRLRGIFVAYAGLIAFAVVFQSQLGENAARLRFLALPLAVLAVRGRPLALAAPLVAAAAVYNVSPLAWSFVNGVDEKATHRSYWNPAIHFLEALADPNYRVNALDTVDHWEAVWLPEAGIPITRGWYRQDDFPENAVLYNGELTRAQYVQWLHERAVKYVLVPRDRLDYSSRSEPALARTLRFVAQAGAVSIYAVPNPRKIVPGAEILRLTHDKLILRAPRAGTYKVAIRGHETFVAPSAGVFTIGMA